MTVCSTVASGHLNNDIETSLQAIIKNISSGSVKVKWIFCQPDWLFRWWCMCMFLISANPRATDDIELWRIFCCDATLLGSCIQLLRVIHKDVESYPRPHSRRRGCCILTRPSVCLSVCPRSNRKTAWAINANLGTHMYSIAVARHTLTLRSKGQRSRSHSCENRHGRTVASDACCYGRVLLLPACVCMSIRLSVFSSYKDVESYRSLFIFSLQSLWKI